MIQLPKMSKRVLLSRTLLLLCASTSNDITASGVQLAGDTAPAVGGARSSDEVETATRGDQDRPLNILFLTQGSTELKAAHAGMKWLAEQMVDGTTAGEKRRKYNVAYLFAASTTIKAGDGSDGFTEESAEESGWLLRAAAGAGETVAEAQKGVHPLDANDVPQGLPAFGAHNEIARLRLVPTGWPQWKELGDGDQIIQRMQPPSKDLRILKSAGVHLIPYRLFGFASNNEEAATETRRILSPAPYVDYLKHTIFKDGEIDLLVSDILVYTDETPNNVFDGAFKQDMRKEFFPQLKAKKVVRWSGNQDAVNEVAAAAFGNVQEGKLPRSPVISATPFPMLTAPSFRESQTKRKHDSLDSVPLYFPKNVDGVEVGPIGLVMQHPAGETVENDKKVDSDTVQKIRKRLHREDDLSLDGLIFVAFGTQGNGFSKDGVRFLVRELVNASPTNLVYLVRPKLLPDEEGGEPVSPKDSDAFFRSLQDDAILTKGRLLVHDTDNAPQLEIFQAFAPRFGKYNAQAKLNFSFLTHGGAGSLSEALGLGIPVLCLPLLNTDKEQADNCQRVADQGLGRDLGKLTMVMAFRGFVAPIVYTAPAENKLQWIKSVVIRHATGGSTPGQERNNDRDNEPDRTNELQGLDDVSTHHQEVLRTFYEQAASFREPAAAKLAEDSREQKAGEAQPKATAVKFDYDAFFSKKHEEWLSFPWEHLRPRGFAGDGVLEAEAALLSASTEMRQKILRKLQANLEKVKINTLNRDVDVGPLLAKFAENPVPTEGWISMED